MAEVRVDKYLFAMRIYKTRSIAADACKKGRITMNGVQLKPARCFHVGDTFSVRKGPITYSYRVLQLSEKRLGAKLVPDYMRDVTAPDQLELLELARLGGQSGRYERIGEATGHPTKKDRREYETFISSLSPVADATSSPPKGKGNIRMAASDASSGANKWNDLWIEDWDEDLDWFDELEDE